MTLPSLDKTWRNKQRFKPRICLLEVRDREKPDGVPIAWLFVERKESYRRDNQNGVIHTASIRLSYETIEPKYSCRAQAGEVFSGSYSRGYSEDNESVSLVGAGGLFLDPDELCGQRIGTYLMNEIVVWAQQWPEATVGSINLKYGQSQDYNLERRNRFYERFGLVFDYHDPEHRAGVSRPMPAKALTPVTSWEANIQERDPHDYLGELLYERQRMEMDASQSATAIKNLSSKLREARNHPVRWAASQLWWRLSPYLLQGLALLAFGALVWVGFQSR
jgi:hypothetical protein